MRHLRHMRYLHLNKLKKKYIYSNLRLKKLIYIKFKSSKIIDASIRKLQ